MAKSQIIKDLANGSIDTQIALKRTKVLLQEFDDERLLEWVNYEIEGYPNDVEVPEYRRISGQSFCSYIKGTMSRFLKYSNVPLSLGNMPENEREIFYYANMRESVGLLFTPAPCTCCMASEQAPKCVLFSILCASIVAIHTEIVVSICEIWRKCEL